MIGLIGPMFIFCRRCNMKKHNKIILLIFYLNIIFISCNTAKFKISEPENEINQVKIIAFGVGKSPSRMMAKTKSEHEARNNLVSQINGLTFTYKENNNTVNFNAFNKGQIEKVRPEKAVYLSGNRVLSVVSTLIEPSNINTDKAKFFETSFRTEDLDLTRVYKEAVQEVIKKHSISESEITGKLYLTDLDISNYEKKDEFLAKVKILIVLD